MRERARWTEVVLGCSTVICSEKKRLLDELAVVIKSILDLHNEEAQFLIDGDYTPQPAILERLKNEQAKRASLMAELKQHAGTHCC